MVYNLTLLRIVSIFFLFFIFFEIIGHFHELFFIELYSPYNEYLQTSIVRFFYWATLILLVLYFSILIYINFQKFFFLTKFIRFTLLFISILIVSNVLLKTVFIDPIESKPYFIDKSIVGMAHYLGIIPALIIFLFAMILFLKKNVTT